MESPPITLPPIQDEALKRRQLQTMKFRATGLLVLAAIVFVIAHWLEHTTSPGWGYLRATAEAAMVGAIADWFAVTALFRYPLNIPIPHTAIIPRRKDRIGRSLGNFVEHNFLSPPVITAKLRSAGVGRKLAEWLSVPENGDAVGRHVSAAATGVLQVLKDEEVQELIESSLVSRIRKTHVAPLAGNVLSLVTAGDRHQELLDSAVRLLERLVDENREAIRDRIGKETPWWMPQAVDDKIYQKVVGGIDATLHEVATDPDHPLRERFNEAVSEFIQRLRESPEMLERGEGIKEELLSHPAVRDYSVSLWTDMKASFLRHADDPESAFRRRVGAAVNRFGATLMEDEELMEKVEGWVEGAVLYLVDQYRHEAGDLIATTVSAWDPEDTTRKIELQIGKDLQFIRINGTLVGGLAGLVIYSLSRFFTP
jgi:uncharacterized membrane-anchored protein YjiN (DUF445 family)